jgi:hypothetical protein
MPLIGWQGGATGRYCNRIPLFGSACLSLLCLWSVTSPATAEWSASATGNLFYTDDVALFSATRRLNLHGDPTQPVLDTSLVGKGSDMVFEPDVSVTKSLESKFGRTEFTFRGQAFVYAVNPNFNHGSVGFEALHHFSSDTRVRLRYYATPNMLLGDNESRRTESVEEERVTSHIGSIRLERNLSKDWEVRLLARYGARLYNDAFAQRDTTFWTVGPHLVWHFKERYALILGYHYERGLADGRNQPQFKDDTSYINNYMTIGLEAEVTERISVEAGLHFERNNWTSGIEGDERKGGHETVWEGELAWRYRVFERATVLASVQRAQRRQSFEHELVYNTNISLGATYSF